MKDALTLICLVVLALSGLVEAQEAPASKIAPCLIVAHYGNDGPFFYRDQYGVPVDHLQLAYSSDELNYVLKNGVKIVVYDVKEHESFAEARESCFLTRTSPFPKD
jgi:hypothetical protein